MEAAQSQPVSRRGDDGFCIWLTGLSGAGKTTIGDLVAKRLADGGRQVTFLDGDLVRTHLSRGLGFSREDRDTNVRRVGFVAGEIVRHRGAVICAVISPYEEARSDCRALVGEDRFVLVWVATPLAECERRDPKGLYARARRGEIAGFTGIDDPYEPPARPDLALHTSGRPPEACAEQILRHLVGRGLLAADRL